MLSLYVERQGRSSNTKVNEQIITRFDKQTDGSASTTAIGLGGRWKARRTSRVQRWQKSWRCVTRTARQARPRINRLTQKQQTCEVECISPADDDPHLRAAPKSQPQPSRWCSIPKLSPRIPPMGRAQTSASAVWLLQHSKTFSRNPTPSDEVHCYDQTEAPPRQLSWKQEDGATGWWDYVEFKAGRYD